MELESLSKPPRRRQRECRQTKQYYACAHALFLDRPLQKQLLEITKFIARGTRTTTTNILYFHGIERCHFKFRLSKILELIGYWTDLGIVVLGVAVA